MGYDEQQAAGLSDQELAGQAATALPDKEVVSILDLNADLNLAIDAAAPIDLAVAANANVAAPIEAAVGGNILSAGSTAQSMTDQGALINQHIAADATAHSTQDSGIDQAGATDPASSTDTSGATDPTTTGGASTTTTSDPASALSDGNLLNVDVNLDANADIAAPINGAVAANANVAAPIDASVAANVGSIDSNAVSIGQQDAIINQDVTGSATATTDQTSDISQ